MTITVNDKAQSFSGVSTLQDLVESLGFTEKTGIAIAVNDAVVTRRAWADSILRETDHITIIQATQGG